MTDDVRAILVAALDWAACAHGEGLWQFADDAARCILCGSFFVRGRGTDEQLTPSGVRLCERLTHLTEERPGALRLARDGVRAIDLCAHLQEPLPPPGTFATCVLCGAIRLPSGRVYHFPRFQTLLDAVRDGVEGLRANGVSL